MPKYRVKRRKGMITATTFLAVSLFRGSQDRSFHAASSRAREEGEEMTETDASQTGGI